MPARIRIIKGGPYEVTGDIPLKECSMEPGTKEAPEFMNEIRCLHPGKGRYYLCRCGRSYSKPFCDGSHEAIDFEGIEIASREKYADAAKIYNGEFFDLMDNKSLCAHARFCNRGEGAWKMTTNSSDPKTAELAREIINSCPSGRLTAREKNGTISEKPLEKEIHLVRDPHNSCRAALYVTGGIELESADGSTYEVRNRMTLCRCGESSNLPFCDSAHVGCRHMKLEK